MTHDLVTFDVPIEPRAGQLLISMSTAGSGRCHPDDVLMEIDFESGRAFGLANPLCSRTSDECLKVPRLADRFRVESRSRVLQLSFLATQAYTVCGDVSLRFDNAGVIRVGGNQRRFPILEILQQSSHEIRTIVRRGNIVNGGALGCRAQ